jgi:hypothetical protein
VSLPEITDEDRAVADEAERLWLATGTPGTPGIIELAAALVRTGWKPVDPDLILAREVCAETFAGCAVDYRSGSEDKYSVVKIALAAIKAADARRRGVG